MTMDHFMIQKYGMASTLFKSVVDSKFSKVKFLLDNGVDSRIKTDSGSNLLVAALHIRDGEKRDRMFRYLLKRGADCCDVDPQTGRDVLAWACALGHSQQVRRILETAIGDINLNLKDKAGMTALHYATESGRADMVQDLVRAMNKFHLSIDVPNSDGLTPFMYANRLGHFDVVDILVNEGKSSSTQFDSATHRPVDEWIIIGKKERLKRMKVDLKNQQAQYKIKGKIFKPEKLDKLVLPEITISNVRDSEMAQDDPSPLQSQRAKVVLPDIKHKSSTSQADELVTPQTAFELIGLGADPSENSAHTSTFVSSQLDTSKAAEFGSVLGSVNTMMEVLSSQQSDSFRAVAKPPTPPPTLPPKVTQPEPKKKVSTLAILFGKNNTKQRHGHRKRPAANGSRSRATHTQNKKKAMKSRK